MKFYIKGDKKQITDALKEFCEIWNEEYDVVAEKTKDKILKKLPEPLRPSEVPTPLVIPGYYEEGEYIVFEVPFEIPKFLFLMKGKIKKKMKEQLENFLKAKGVEFNEVKCK